MHIRADAEFPLRQWKSATSTPHPHTVRAPVAMHVCVNQEIPNVFVYPVFHSPLFIFIMLCVCVCVCLFLWVHIHFKRESVQGKKNPATPLMSLFSSVWANYHMLFELAYLPPPTSIILMEPLQQQQQRQIFFPPPLSIQMKISRCFKNTLNLHGTSEGLCFC